MTYWLSGHLGFEPYTTVYFDIGFLRCVLLTLYIQSRLRSERVLSSGSHRYASLATHRLARFLKHYVVGTAQVCVSRALCYATLQLTHAEVRSRIIYSQVSPTQRYISRQIRANFVSQLSQLAGTIRPVSAAAVDIYITAWLCYHLHDSKTGHAEYVPCETLKE